MFSRRQQIQNDAIGTAATFDDTLQSASELLARDPAEALALANALIAQRADARAFRLAAAALRSLDRHDEAEQMELQGIKSGFAQPLKLARAAQQARRSGEAKSLAEDYLRTNPDDLLAMTIAGEAAVGLRQFVEAEPILRRVVDRAPAFAPANLLLANALFAQLRLREAADVLEKLLKRVPQELGAKRFLADISNRMNEPTAAARFYGDVLASGRGNPSDQLKLAQSLRMAGSRAECVAALRRSIEMSPPGGHAWWALAHYFADDLTEDDERQIMAEIGNPSVQQYDLGLFHLAASILEHRKGNYEAAFNWIVSSASLIAAKPGYDADGLSRYVDELIAAYTPEVFERFASEGSTSDAPIFIVGMPRSGSTLLERILGQHSKIEAIGEIPLIPRLVADSRPDGIAAYRSLLPDVLTGEKLADMAEWYLRRTQDYRHTDKAYFTDKYNGNWIRSGLIRLMFPNAKILDIRRSPLDSCWAVFKSVFIGDYALDQRDLAKCYVDYARLMDAMAAGSPSHVLSVSYEDLVADIEGQTRRILEFLDLEFEQACVDFHLSKATVTTASSEQVRRPINREGIGSAEPYRQWLQPLIAELDSALGGGN